MRSIQYLKMKKTVLAVAISVAILLSPKTNFAQRDTSTPQTVTIVSAYKPVVQKAAKILFTGSALTPDTNRIVQPYRVPVQNLMYVYQPISLRPLSYTQTETESIGLYGYVQAGYGNLRSLTLDALISYQQPEQYRLSSIVQYESAKGKQYLQQYSRLNWQTDGQYQTGRHIIEGNLTFKRDQFYLFGFDSSVHRYGKNETSQRFQLLQMSVGLHQHTLNDWGIDYQPMLTGSLFSLSNRMKENSIGLLLPFSKQINEKWTASLAGNLRMTNVEQTVTASDKIRYNNNLIELYPNVNIQYNALKARVGANLFSSQGTLGIQPRIEASYSMLNTKLILQAGWEGRIEQNSMERLSGINPYLASMGFQKNTRAVELYGGIRSKLGQHVLASAKISWISYRDFALFIQDTVKSSDQKSYLIAYEPTMSNFRLHGDVSYRLRDKWDVGASMDINAFAGMDVNKRAWNTIPLETTVYANWQPIKELKVCALLHYFAGGKFLKPDQQEGEFQGAADLSFTARYRFFKNWGAFVELNNIFGTNYQRWYRYPVMGFQALGGIRYNLNP